MGIIVFVPGRVRGACGCESDKWHTYRARRVTPSTVIGPQSARCRHDRH